MTCNVFMETMLLNSAVLSAMGSGKVQTLMSVDVERAINLFLSFHDLWSLPLQIVVALWLLYTQASLHCTRGILLCFTEDLCAASFKVPVCT
jgi:ATP-binding cassette subfamily C (CFTR/MRP) protein 10